MAIQEFWVDPSVSPGGAGTSSADPYDRLDLAVTAATGSEAYINVKRGHIYAPYGSAPGVLSISGKAPAGFLRVRSYGDADMPPTLFSGTNMLPGDAGWSYAGAGIWKKALSSNTNTLSPQIARLYVGGSRPTGPALNRSLGTGYSFGTARARFAALFDTATEEQILAQAGTMGLTELRIWFYTLGVDGGTLYVYTGTALQDPPTFYEGITLVGSNGLYDAQAVGRNYGAWAYECSRLHVKGIDSIFAATVGLRLHGNGTASTDVKFSNCNAYAFGGGGVLIGNSNAIGGLVTRGILEDSTIDATATLAEDYNYPTKSSNGAATQTNDWIYTGQDASMIGYYTESCMLNRVTTKDGAHGNTYIGTTRSDRSGTANAMVIDCVGSQAGRKYGALLGGAGLGVGNVATITRFVGSDATTFTSRTGSGKVVLNSCVFKRGMQPFPAYDDSAGGGPGTGSGVNTIPAIYLLTNAAFGAFEAPVMTFNNCTVLQPYGWLLRIDELGSAGSIPTGSIVMNDTLLVDTQYLNDSAARNFNPVVYPKPGISWDMRGNSQLGTVVMNNCYQYTGASGHARVATSNTVTKTFAQYATDGFLVGTINEVDPMVDDNGFIQSTLSPLYHAGVHSTYKRDVKGMQFNNPPSVGAYEYVEARPSRL